METTKKEMHILEAIQILHPQLREAALKQIPEEEVGAAVDEASLIACMAMDRNIIIPAENKSIGVWRCPICGKIHYSVTNFCGQCGQALDFDGHSKKVIEVANSGIIIP